MVVIFPLGTSHPPTVVLSRATFGRDDMLPQVQQNGQRKPQRQTGFVTAAQVADAAQGGSDRAGVASATVTAPAAVGVDTGSQGLKARGQGSKRQKVNQTYTYVDLGSLPMHGTENIYGVISEFRMPRQTKGTDYLMNLTLIDPSSADDSPPVRFIGLY